MMTRLPRAVLKFCLRAVLKLLYRVEVHGIEKLPNEGEPGIIFANHTSYLDAALINAFVPGRVAFAIDKHIASRWWVRLLTCLIETFEMNQEDAHSLKRLIQRVEEGQRSVIFPEGRITTTGTLMRIYEGPAMILQKSGAPFVPIHLEGCDRTPLSYMQGKRRIRWFPKISVHVGDPVKSADTEEYHGKDGRKRIARDIYDALTSLRIEAQLKDARPIYEDFVRSALREGLKRRLTRDVSNAELSYGQLVVKSRVLGQMLADTVGGKNPVGVLLPTAPACTVTILALLSQNQVPAMLNFSSGPQSVLQCTTAACVKHVVSSRTFIEQAKLEGLVEALEKGGLEIHYLEDLQKKRLRYAGLALWTKMAPAMSTRALRKRLGPVSMDDTAVILFTSGSTGSPKGVALSHGNIQANIAQVAAALDFNRQDRLFCALPTFHSFGLTVGVMLPVLRGVKVFYYPSPLHYAVIPELIYHSNSTVLFSTNTFLQGYAKKAHPFSFQSVRYIFAGAEKLQDDTRAIYAEHFGVRIMEGYGVTETSPVLNMNRPLFFKKGTVGRFCGGIEYKLEAIPGIEEGGKLWVKGPNIMKGYFMEDQPGALQPPEGGWHDTGDIAVVDEEGFLSIVGRAKRFAKIGGEMISLSAVEELAVELWPGEMHACISIPDKTRGEVLVLVSEKKDVERKAFSDFVKACQHTELMVPKRIEHMAKVPVLGSGKIDYVSLQKHFAE